MTRLIEAVRELAVCYKLRRCAEVGPAVAARGTIWVHGAGSVRLGARVILDGGAVPIELHAAEGAEIVLEDDVRIEGGVSIEARRSVRIGARARVGRGCKILDNHFHRVGCRDDRPQSVPVIIEEDAELGARAILLPGAHVGRAAVVRAGTVLGRRVPPEVIVAGMPATLVKA